MLCSVGGGGSVVYNSPSPKKSNQSVTVNTFTGKRITLRLADALKVTDFRHDTQVENTGTCMVTTSNLEVLGVDLNGAMSNYLRLALLVLLSSLLTT